MWELDYKESWVPNNWCFQTAVLEKLLRVPWTARRSNQSILKEISPEYSSEGLMLKLKLPILWPPDVKNWLTGKRPWCWERLKAGEGDDRGGDGWMASLTQWTWLWASSRRRWRTGKPGVLQFMVLQRSGHDWASEQQLCKLLQRLEYWLQSSFFKPNFIELILCARKCSEKRPRTREINNRFHILLQLVQTYWASLVAQTVKNPPAM